MAAITDSLRKLAYKLGVTEDEIHRLREQK